MSPSSQSREADMQSAAIHKITHDIGEQYQLSLKIVLLPPKIKNGFIISINSIMKGIFRNLAIVAILSASLLTGKAQAPYKNGFGISVGSMQALSFKTFGGDHFAFQMDLGTMYVNTSGRFQNVDLKRVALWTLELNPNFMFEGHLVGGLYGLAGLGGSIGYCWSDIQYQGVLGLELTRRDFGKCGANGIVGLEYKFRSPLALQIDFRPGYGCLFAKHFAAHYFDWSANLGVHYAF